MSSFETRYLVAFALVFGSMFLAAAINRWRIDNRRLWPDSDGLSLLVWIAMLPIVFLVFGLLDGWWS